MALGSWIKYSLLEAAHLSGCNLLNRHRTADKLVVLCYHGVVANDHRGELGYMNTVSVAEFRDQMQTLARVFRPVSAADVAAARSGTRPLPRHAALVTFDDGYQNNLTLAAGVLKEAGVPAVFHVSTGYIGTKRILWPDELIGCILNWRGEHLPLPGGGSQPLTANQLERRQVAFKIKERCKTLPADTVDTYVEQLRTS